MNKLKLQKRLTPIVGEIKKVIPHPNADHLYIASVDVGNPELVTVIFGGDRILKPRDLVPIALKGTRLASGEKIRPRKWRGVKSYAELLSRDELGWTMGGPDEVLVLSPNKYHVGEEV